MPAFCGPIINHRLLPGLWKTILAGEVWRGELINRRKDGTLYAEKMSITPVHDSLGSITNFIAVKQEASHPTEALAEQER